jgi:tellurite methyltransferase
MVEQSIWNERYETPDFIHGVEPSEFLKDNLGLLPGSGMALDIAAGEGRNSVFLAECGYSVIAVDISERALQKCRRLARDRAVRVETVAADLREFSIPGERFSLIVNFNYLQRDLAPGIVAGLRAGGVLIFETLTGGQLRWRPDFNADYLLRPGELVQLFHGLHLLKYRETDLSTGTKMRSVAGLIARKE